MSREIRSHKADRSVIALFWTLDGRDDGYRTFPDTKAGRSEAEQCAQAIRPEHLPARIISGTIQVRESVTFVEDNTDPGLFDE